MSKYVILAVALQNLESRIFVHASLKQIGSVESFLLVAVRKAKLENEISLVANWTDADILRKKIKIIISAQNEIPNVEHLEKIFNVLTMLNFRHFQFIKYVEYLDDEKGLEDLSASITSTTTTTKSITVKVSDLKFHVARYGSDDFGRSIKLNVYTNVQLDELLESTKEEDHWIPNPNLFYLLDLVFGEYYMTKYITTINFFPSIIMPQDTKFLNATEAKENIDILLGLEHEHCSVCNIPEYRTKLIDQPDSSKKCINC